MIGSPRGPPARRGGYFWEVFRYRILQLQVPLKDKARPLPHLARAIGVPPRAVRSARPVRLSLDNRRERSVPRWVFQMEFELDRPIPESGNVVAVPEGDARPPLLESPGTLDLPERIHVVGAGPAGLWAAWTLARRGYRVTLHERGKAVEERYRDIRRFVKERELDPESNALFGEGGAGFYSDGKLTSRTRNEFTAQVLRDLADLGAPEEVQWLAKAHLGTDRLQLYLKELRSRLLALGAEIRFGSRVEEIDVRAGHVRAIRANGVEIPAECVVLAAGHSARDVYRMLDRVGVALEPKGFAVGIRAEHPQSLIDRRHFGPGADLSLTGPAEYVLKAPASRGGAYSFCMCPGGVLVPCSTARGQLATNGMSYSGRSGKFANAGIVVPVDLTAEGLFAGLEFQEELERRAFEMGGSDFGAPAQSVAAFVAGRADRGPLPESTWPTGLVPSRLSELFGPRLTEALASSLVSFDRAIPGFVDRGLAVGPETRTSSPLRVLRDPETLRAAGTEGLYPLGEGAGYSGGIVSSAADGVRLGVLAKRRIA